MPVLLDRTCHLTPLVCVSHFDSCALFWCSVISLFPLTNSEFLQNRVPHFYSLWHPKAWSPDFCPFVLTGVFICQALLVCHFLPFEMATMTFYWLLLPVVLSWSLAPDLFFKAFSPWGGSEPSRMGVGEAEIWRSSQLLLKLPPTSDLLFLLEVCVSQPVLLPLGSLGFLIYKKGTL